MMYGYIVFSYHNSSLVANLIHRPFEINCILFTLNSIGTAVTLKISEIDAVLAQMDKNSTEYALITSIKNLLGDITALLTSSRVVRSAASEMKK